MPHQTTGPPGVSLSAEPSGSWNFIWTHVSHSLVVLSFLLVSSDHLFIQAGKIEHKSSRPANHLLRHHGVRRTYSWYFKQEP